MPKVFPPVGPPTPPTGTGVLLLIQPNPYASLYALDVPTDPPTKVRVTSYPTNPAYPAGVALYFETDSLGAAVPYYSGSIGHEERQADTEGGVQRITITLQNVTREGIALAESFSGLVGQTVRHVVVRVDELPNATPLIDEYLEIVASDFTENVCQFTCGRTALLQKKFPDRRISRIRCGHRYGGVGCGYDTTRGGALPTCDFSLEGANGCYIHGDDEEGAGLENRHDRNGKTRALIFPGVARSSGIDSR